MSRGLKILTGLFGTALFVIFIAGLSHSISTGFAGLSGGLPFMLIAILICCAAVYNFWEECVIKK
tara:strand:- start:213 stop:407 length:195 start_codon:yes stop_codon:yes gene_type:complete